jgi:hypothetical protein
MQLDYGSRDADAEPENNLRFKQLQRAAALALVLQTGMGYWVT